MDGYRFNPPPNWPAPPPGWVPSPGWRPSPEWPAPPPGWQLWIDDLVAAPSQPISGPPPRPPRQHRPRKRRRLRYLLLTVAGVVIVIIALTVGIYLSKHSGATNSSASASSNSPTATASSTALSAPAVALTCKQQGARWKADNRRTIREFNAALVPFQSGSVTSAQAQALTEASQAMLAAALPACADPKGYYTQAMANLATAGQAASGGGALSEMGALTPMENALTALNELSAELKHTIGSNKI